MESSARREESEWTPRAIYERLSRYVIGQEAAKRAVSVAAHSHLRRIEARRLRRDILLRKSNILLIGPTGSGKTHLARHLASILSVPFTTVDATEYTEAGYYGKDVEVMISDLLLKASHSIEDTQRGIIFIDEVDKIARRTQGARNGAGSRDIGGEGVQQALLKMLEGREVFVPTQVSQGWNKADTVQIDTHDILFICAGTFSDLHAERGGRQIGFGSAEVGSVRKRLCVKDLVDFGMLAEFLGRLPVMVQLEALEEDDLVRILREPPDAVTREFHELLALDGVDVQFAPDGLRAMVRFAMDKGMGARGLRSVLEHVMADVLFEAPERRHAKLTVDRAFVNERLEREGLRI